MMRKAKAQLELNLAMEVRNSKGFFSYFSQKRKTKENVPLLINKTEYLVMTDVEKAEVFNKFFASIFTGSCSSRIS